MEGNNTKPQSMINSTEYYETYFLKYIIQYSEDSKYIENIPHKNVRK